MACLSENKTDDPNEGSVRTHDGGSTVCKVDCTGQIIIAVGAGVLVGAVVLVAGRWGLRYMVMGNDNNCQ